MRLRVFVATLLSISAFGQPLPQGVEKKASIGGITQYDYPNGLRVVLIPGNRRDASLNRSSLRSQTYDGNAPSASEILRIRCGPQ